MLLPPPSAALLESLRPYLDLLDRWNRIHALTALPEEERVEELIQDSTALLPFLEPLGRGSRILDFGTGMGVPAVVLACARPDLHVLALDKSKKKIAFLKQVCLELKLANLEPVLGLAEQLAPAGAALGTAKAVGTLGLLASWWDRHGLPEAPLLALKGPDWAQESIPAGWTLDTCAYRLPHRGERVIVQMKKTAGSLGTPLT
jgi:16S rRNA (guanine527-N7)-methyltransferase